MQCQRCDLAAVYRIITIDQHRHKRVKLLCEQCFWTALDKNVKLKAIVIIGMEEVSVPNHPEP